MREYEKVPVTESETGTFLTISLSDEQFVLLHFGAGFLNGE
jgi:hypothetical protein